jgi:hypothetical protein
MKINKKILGVVAISVFTLAISTSSANASTASSTMNKVARQSQNLETLITKSNIEITKRITSLNNLNTRVQGMKNVNSVEKSSITNEVNIENANLNTLKSKIDADTDITVAHTDSQEIFGGFRIYALVLPQGNIEVAADRVTTIVGLMNTISAKLQTRITTLQSEGKDVSALQASLTDMNAKLSDATGQSGSAQSGVASLKPDNGDKTILASNTTALQSARANIKNASADLKAARADITAIVKGIRSDKNTKTTASTTVNTQ